MIGLRASPELRNAVEKWAENEPDKPKLSEAVRRLVEMGLAGAQSTAPRNKRAAATARKLARATIDELSDLTVPPEEQAKRKQRLIKGPREFRELRGEKPKAGR